MQGELLTGNASAAWGARLADVDYIPAFPITPQTEIIELLAQWTADGTMPARFVTMDSEHSMLTAAGAAAAAGARVFTATSSQGILYGFEMLYSIAGWRVPMVLINVSRGLSSPITLEADHNDILSARDSGFLQIHAETCQEILDSILMAYRLAEDERVMLPVLVNLDGFTLSFTREPVVTPEPEAVSTFLPTYEPNHAFIRGDRPMAQGTTVLGGAIYSYFRYQQHLAQQNALEVHEEVAAAFQDQFGRHYGLFEPFQLDDADYVLVMSNAFATKGKAAVQRLRAQGVKAGLLRLRVLRPFPVSHIADALEGRKAVAIIDQNLAPGLGGITYQEVAATLYGRTARPPLLSVIGGLGGKDISVAEFDAVFQNMARAAAGHRVESPLLLYTQPEQERMQDLLRIAGKEIAV
ncbi:MAG: pyruvate synthase [Candidatus Entotheonella factor]|uniref:Pyruvate synthase n=1 Tax=Entotheonella factor TaxID=1429438 RepID=W4LJ73_ENTF1|nr:pyruvate synthase [Candidatus Entotheonella palauensis]ETW97381.1 MAG: pyruvate synthase [Candidatus Entotheonella factor]